MVEENEDGFGKILADLFLCFFPGKCSFSIGKCFDKVLDFELILLAELYCCILGSSTPGQPVRGQYEAGGVGPTQPDVNVHSHRGRHAGAATPAAIGR